MVNILSTSPDPRPSHLRGNQGIRESGNLILAHPIYVGITGPDPSPSHLRGNQGIRESGNLILAHPIYVGIRESDPSPSHLRGNQGIRVVLLLHCRPITMPSTWESGNSTGDRKS